MPNNEFILLDRCSNKIQDYEYSYFFEAHIQHTPHNYLKDVSNPIRSKRNSIKFNTKQICVSFNEESLIHYLYDALLTIPTEILLNANLITFSKGNPGICYKYKITGNNSNEINKKNKISLQNLKNKFFFPLLEKESKNNYKMRFSSILNFMSIDSKISKNDKKLDIDLQIIDDLIENNIAAIKIFCRELILLYRLKNLDGSKKIEDIKKLKVHEIIRREDGYHFAYKVSYSDGITQNLAANISENKYDMYNKQFSDFLEAPIKQYEKPQNLTSLSTNHFK